MENTKILVISDIHGRNNWINIVNNNINNVDKIVFLGDYFDSFNIQPFEQIVNFKEIIKLKQQYLDKVILLLGNHDYHYLKFTNTKYSGFNFTYQHDIYDSLKNNLDLLQICYINGNVIFSHAGLSKYWLKLTKIKYNTLDDLSYKVNNILTDSPQWLDFAYLKPKNKSLTTLYPDPYGENIYQTPLWVRPNSLCSNDSVIKNTIQVVGHTHQKGIFIRELTKFNSKVIFTDVYDTVNETIIINIKDNKYIGNEIV